MFSLSQKSITISFVLLFSSYKYTSKNGCIIQQVLYVACVCVSCLKSSAYRVKRKGAKTRFCPTVLQTASYSF